MGNSSSQSCMGDFHHLLFLLFTLPWGLSSISFSLKDQKENSLLVNLVNGKTKGKEFCM